MPLVIVVLMLLALIFPKPAHALLCKPGIPSDLLSRNVISQYFEHEGVVVGTVTEVTASPMAIPTNTDVNNVIDRIQFPRAISRISVEKVYKGTFPSEIEVDSTNVFSYSTQTSGLERSSHYLLFITENNGSLYANTYYPCSYSPTKLVKDAQLDILVLNVFTFPNRLLRGDPLAWIGIGVLGGIGVFVVINRFKRRH